MGMFSKVVSAATGGVLDWAKDSIMANSANAKAKRAATVAWNRTMDADNTKYQRTMADMKEAGLNPILGMSEAGATSPGQAATAETHQANETRLTNALNTAANLKNAESTALSAKGNSAAQYANAVKTLYEAGLINKYGGKKAAAEIQNLETGTGLTKEKTNTQKFVNKMGGNVDNAMGTLGEIAEGMGQGVAKIYDEMSYNSKNRKYHSAKNSKEAWQNIMN